MKSTKRDDAGSRSVGDLRKKIRAQVEEETLSVYNEALGEGKYPWEGMWLTPHQISMVQERLKKKDKVLFFELLALFIFMLLMLQMFAQFTLGLLPGQDSKRAKDNPEHARSGVGPEDRKEEAPVAVVKVSNAPSGTCDPQKANIISDASVKSGAAWRGTVITNSVRLRKGPGTNFAVISELQHGEAITVTEQKGPWLRISASQADGWVHGDYVNVDN